MRRTCTRCGVGGHDKRNCPLTKAGIVVSDDHCRVLGCKGESHLLYAGRPTCAVHWVRHCDDTDAFDLKEIYFGTGEKEGGLARFRAARTTPTAPPPTPIPPKQTEEQNRWF